MKIYKIAQVLGAHPGVNLIDHTKVRVIPPPPAAIPPKILAINQKWANGAWLSNVRLFTVDIDKELKALSADPAELRKIIDEVTREERALSSTMVPKPGLLNVSFTQADMTATPPVGSPAGTVAKQPLAFPNPVKNYPEAIKTFTKLNNLLSLPAAKAKMTSDQANKYVVYLDTFSRHFPKILPSPLATKWVQWLRGQYPSSNYGTSRYKPYGI